MEIFKDELAHSNICADLVHVYTCFNEVKTRLAEKTLDTLLEGLSEEMHLNLTEEAAPKAQALMEQNPDSDFEGVVELLVFKNSAKIESAKDFVTRTTIPVDEDVVAQVRVYKDDLYIEVGSDGRHCLTLENYSWIEPDTSLDTMELELFNYAKISNGG